MEKSTKKLTFIAVMTALSYILYFLEFSVGFIFPTAPFLKIDLSDLPVIITTIRFDIFSGILVDLLKNILHISISKDPSFSGEISNFLYCLSFIIPLAISLNKKRETLKFKLIFSIIFSTISMCFVNYFLTLPIYGITVNRLSLILSAFVPFNILKGILISIISFYLNKHLIINRHY